MTEKASSKKKIIKILNFAFENKDTILLLLTAAFALRNIAFDVSFLEKVFEVTVILVGLGYKFAKEVLD